MDVGFSLHQVSGRKVDNESVCQRRNSGGSARGFCADIHSCDGRGVLLTTATYETLAEVERVVEWWVRFFAKAQSNLSI